MNETKILIKISSHHLDLSPEAKGEEPDECTMTTEGTLTVDGGQVTVTYAETELTGMAGSTTTVRFDTAVPGLVTMLRTGTVNTVLVFEQGQQHICAYRTPYMPIELCVRTYRVVNELLEEGLLFLDYTVEIRGARLERTRFSLEINAEDEHLSDLLAHDVLPSPTPGEQA